MRREVEEARRQRAENEERERKRIEEDRLRREGSEVDYGIEQTPSYAMNNSSKAQQSRPQQRLPRTSVSRPNTKAVAPQTFTGQASLLLSRLRTAIQELAFSLNGNPVLLMRLLAFVMGLLIMVGHQGIRQRVQRILGASWNKVKMTAGMGAKVSYI